MGFSATSLLLLPLLILVLHVGHQRRKATMSHSDFFTYNMVAMELISMAGGLITCCGASADVQSLIVAGMYMFSFSEPGQMLLDILTCAEHYLAVIHPLRYRDLRQSAGVRIRTLVAGGVWLLCFVSLGLTEDLLIHFNSTMAMFFWVSTFAVVLVCSLSVLCVLIRPRPGERLGARDQLKQRAVITITVILGALLLKFLGIFICIVIYSLSALQEERCLLLLSIPWFSLPSSLVLPLLFLQRAGKLPSCS